MAVAGDSLRQFCHKPRFLAQLGEPPQVRRDAHALACLQPILEVFVNELHQDRPARRDLGAGDIVFQWRTFAPPHAPRKERTIC